MRRLLLLALLLLPTPAAAFDPWAEQPFTYFLTIAAADGAQSSKQLVAPIVDMSIMLARSNFVCSNANTVDVQAYIGFSAAGATTISAPTNAVSTTLMSGHPKTPAGSGLADRASNGPLGKGPKNGGLYLTMASPTSGECYISGTYYKVP